MLRSRSAQGEAVDKVMSCSQHTCLASYLLQPDSCSAHKLKKSRTGNCDCCALNHFSYAVIWLSSTDNKSHDLKSIKLIGHFENQ